MAFTLPRLIARDVNSDDHHRAGYFVLNVIGGDRLIADAAFCTGAGAPIDLVIGFPRSRTSVRPWDGSRFSGGATSRFSMPLSPLG